MIFQLQWVPLSCEFFENETIVVLTEQAQNSDMPTTDLRTYGPTRVQTYDGITWDLTAATWTYQEQSYETEESVMDAWVLVMEGPPLDPPIEP